MHKQCPKCGEVTKMTKHHVFPRRNFGKGRQNSTYFWLCWECHQELEKMIPYKRQRRKFYTQIIQTFLKGGGD